MKEESNVSGHSGNPIDAQFLKKFSIFEALGTSDLKAIAAIAQEREVLAGEAIFHDGQKATSFYFIRSGTVDILKQGKEADDLVLISLSGNSHFGEMGLLDHEANRTASAVAKENCHLIEIGYDAFEKLLQTNHELGYKVYKSMARWLCRRIRKTNMELSGLKELKLRHL